MNKPPIPIPSRPLTVRLDLIDKDPGQPRKSFEDESTKEYIRDLAANIQDKGLIHPIYLRLHPVTIGRYMIVAGECRFRALKLLQAEEFEFRLVEKEIPPYVISMIENEFRRDLNPIEKAESYRECMEREGMSVEDVAAHSGKHVNEIYRFLRFLKLPSEVQRLVREGKLKQGNLKHLSQFKNVAKQIEFAQQLVRGEDPPELVEASTEVRIDGRSLSHLPKTAEGLISRLLEFRGRANRIVPTIEAFMALTEEEQIKAWTSFTAGTRENFTNQMLRFTERMKALNAKMIELPPTKHVPFGMGIARVKPASPSNAPLPVSVNPIGRKKIGS